MISCSPTSGNAFNTAFLKEAFKFIRPGSFFCDGYLVWAAGWTEKIVILGEALGYYLIHGANVSTSAGKDVVRLHKNNNYALDHFRHLHAWLMARGEETQSWHDLIDAYTWRTILYLKLLGKSYDDFSWSECRREGIRKFTRATHFGLWKQIKNITFVFFCSRLGQLRDMGERDS